jgi:nitrogen regulatory protein P-II 2
MHTTRLALVTIIAEPVLEGRITRELRQLGATGFTVVEGRGEGSRGRHAAEIPGVNVRIETIVGHALAQRILEHIAHAYFEDFGVIAFTSEVAVVRSAKYTAPPESR